MDTFLPRALCREKCVLAETVEKTRSCSKAPLGLFSLAFGSEEHIYRRFMRQEGTLLVKGCFS